MQNIEEHKHNNLTYFLQSQSLVLEYLGCKQLKIASITQQTQYPFFKIQIKNAANIIVLEPRLTALNDTNQILNEFDILEKLQEHGLPVLKPLCFCQDSDIIGFPFIIFPHIEGRIFNNIFSLNLSEKNSILTQASQFLKKLHSIPPHGSQLASTQDYSQEIQKWSQLYKQSETKIQTHIEDLIYWLPQNIPIRQKSDTYSICHGTFGLDKILFHPTKNTIVAIIGWSNVNIGHSFMDLSNLVQAYFIQPSSVFLGGIKGIETQSQFPPLKNILESYNNCSSIDVRFQVVINMLRIATILQMEYKESLTGNEYQKQVGLEKLKQSELAAKMGWDIVLELTHGDPFNVRDLVLNDNQKWARWNVSERCQSYYYRVKDFMKKELFPLEKQIYEKVLFRKGKSRWEGITELEQLSLKAKQQGLWTLFLNDPCYGKGLTNLEYTFISELMGYCYWGHEMFNCFAPETGNIKLLISHGTELQKKKYLDPLLEGKCKTFFAMSEKEVSSSDPTNFQTTIKQVQNGYIIRGRKWFVSGAGDVRCKFGIVMGKTSEDATKPMRQQSMIIVDLPNPRIQVVRSTHTFGQDDAPHGYWEVVFDDVFVGTENLLGQEGGAFAMAQGRLVGGRLHHSVRQIGQAARCLDLMMDRADQRVVFKEKLKDIQSFQQKLGELEIKLQSCRLLSYNAAMLLDVLGGRNYFALKAISECKAYIPKTTQKIIDEVIQVFGAEGVGFDQIITQAFSLNRAIRFMDGPCEVHLRQVARFTLGNHMFNDLRQATGYGLPNL